MIGRIQFPYRTVRGYQSLPWSGYWAPNFPGGTYPNSIWYPTPSNNGGISGSNGAIIAGATAPTLGTALAGFTPAHFGSGAGAELTSDVNNTPIKEMSDYVGTTAGGIIAMFNSSALGNFATGNTYDDTPIVIDGNGDFGLTFNSLGMAGFAYDGSYKITASISFSISAWHIVMLAYNGTTLSVQIDSGTAKTVSCGTITVLTGEVLMGLGYAQLHNFAGDIMEFGFFKGYTPTSTDYANYKSYVNSTYSLSL